MRVDTFWTNGAIGWMCIICNDTSVSNVPRIGCFYNAFFQSCFCSEKNVSIFVSCPICKMQYAFLWYFSVNLTKHFSKKAIVDKLKKTGSEIVKQTKQVASSTALAGLYLPEVCQNITSSISFDSMNVHFGKYKKKVEIHWIMKKRGKARCLGEIYHHFVQWQGNLPSVTYLHSLSTTCQVSLSILHIFHTRVGFPVSVKSHGRFFFSL